MSDDLAALAADAYIYGFPLVFDLQMVGGQAQMGMITPGPPAPASVLPELAFFEQLRTWMQAFPPSGPDQDCQRSTGTPSATAPPVRPPAPTWSRTVQRSVSPTGAAGPGSCAEAAGGGSASGSAASNSSSTFLARAGPP